MDQWKVVSFILNKTQRIASYGFSGIQLRMRHDYDGRDEGGTRGGAVGGRVSLMDGIGLVETTNVKIVCTLYMIWGPFWGGMLPAGRKQPVWRSSRIFSNEHARPKRPKSHMTENHASPRMTACVWRQAEERRSGKPVFPRISVRITIDFLCVM